jgi:putative phosphoribosyl transferase
MPFLDRRDAGRRLADRVRGLDLHDVLVLALPRGGVPVAFEVATALGAPLEVFVARKVGAPGHPERGIGAVAEGGGQVVDRSALRPLGLSNDQFGELAVAEMRELDRRVQHYRRGRVLPDLAPRDVVLVDDGLATGVTAEAAMRALRNRHPRRLVLAAPVCAPGTAARLRVVADEVVCVLEPEPFFAVGRWYRDFRPTDDAEVLALLDRAAGRAGVDR